MAEGSATTTSDLIQFSEAKLSPTELRHLLGIPFIRFTGAETYNYAIVPWKEVKKSLESPPADLLAIVYGSCIDIDDNLYFKKILSRPIRSGSLDKMNLEDAKTLTPIERLAYVRHNSYREKANYGQLLRFLLSEDPIDFDEWMDSGSIARTLKAAPPGSKATTPFTYRSREMSLAVVQSVQAAIQAIIEPCVNPSLLAQMIYLDSLLIGRKSRESILSGAVKPEEARLVESYFSVDLEVSRELGKTLKKKGIRKLITGNLNYIVDPANADLGQYSR